MAAKYPDRKLLSQLNPVLLFRSNYFSFFKCLVAVHRDILGAPKSFFSGNNAPKGCGNGHHHRSRSMHFGIFIYDGVEPIDLATFGVLSMARRVAPQLRISTIAPAQGPVRLANDLEVHANFGVDSAPSFDALVITGGPGWEAQCKHPPTLDYLRRTARSKTLITSVCTGGMILAASGALDGLAATTKQEVIEGREVPPLQRMRSEYPEIDVREALLVDSGHIITGGGVTLCIDLTLYLLERLLGADVAAETARIMEYTAARSANRARMQTITC
jgi:transcriptional regulator GlxA family with amidase domain